MFLEDCRYMATKMIQLLLFLVEASDQVSLPIVPLPNATSVQFIYIENSIEPNYENMGNQLILSRKRSLCHYEIRFYLIITVNKDLYLL